MMNKDVSQREVEHIHGIRCDVSSCAYHDGVNYCTAGEVKIGPSYAACSTETVCATYRARYFRTV